MSDTSLNNAVTDNQSNVRLLYKAAGLLSLLQLAMNRLKNILLLGCKQPALPPLCTARGRVKNYLSTCGLIVPRWRREVIFEREKKGGFGTRDSSA